jgi:hypothetical protein
MLELQTTAFELHHIHHTLQPNTQFNSINLQHSSMDVKSLAKSKRNHTQHNKKHHANHKPKLQSQPHSSFSSSSNPNQNDAVKEQVTEKKTNRSKRDSSALPGNWDRYEEEELDSVPESGSKTLDVVVPKSKGADFRFLVAEAQSNADKTLDAFNEALPCM